MREVSATPRKVVAVGVSLETPGWELAFHSHEKTQLMLSLSGVGTAGRLRVPRQRLVAQSNRHGPDGRLAPADARLPVPASIKPG